MSTGADDNAMGVEAGGDTAHQHGNDTEASAHMGCDDVGEEGGAPWVTVRGELLVGARQYASDRPHDDSGDTPQDDPLLKKKKRRRSSSCKKSRSFSGSSPEKHAQKLRNMTLQQARARDLAYLSKQ